MRSYYTLVLSMVMVMVSSMGGCVVSQSDVKIGSYLSLYNGSKVVSPPNSMSAGQYIANNGGYLLFDETGDACHYVGIYPLGDLNTCLSRAMGMGMGTLASSNYSVGAFHTALTNIQTSTSNSTSTGIFFVKDVEIGFRIQLQKTSPTPPQQQQQQATNLVLHQRYTLQVSEFAFWIEDVDGNIYWRPPCPHGQHSVSTTLIRTQCVDDEEIHKSGYTLEALADSVANNVPEKSASSNSSYTLQNKPNDVKFNDVDWNLDDGDWGFLRMLSMLRSRVVSQPIYQAIQEARPPSEGGHQFWVNIRRLEGVVNDVNGRPEFGEGYVTVVRIRMRDDNLYVLGWEIPGPNGGAGDYYYFNDATDSTDFPGARNIQLPLGGSYAALASQRSDAARLSALIGQNNFLVSSERLRQTTGVIGRTADTTISTPDGKGRIVLRQNFRIGLNAVQQHNVATSLLCFIMAIAEAVRFNYIAQRILNNYRNGWAVDGTAVVLTNNWSKLGHSVLQSTQFGIPVPVVQMGNLRLATLWDYSTVLGIILWEFLRH